MEDSILKQLYNGQIYPPEQYHPSSEEYLQKSKTLSEYYENLSSELAGLDPSCILRVNRSVFTDKLITCHGDLDQ